MNTKKVLELNTQQFINDFKRVREIMIQPDLTQEFFKATKKEVWEAAQRSRINYYMSDKVFKVLRDVMVIR